MITRCDSDGRIKVSSKPNTLLSVERIENAIVVRPVRDIIDLPGSAIRERGTNEQEDQEERKTERAEESD